jgi:hypothetical protein
VLRLLLRNAKKTENNNDLMTSADITFRHMVFRVLVFLVHLPQTSSAGTYNLDSLNSFRDRKSAHLILTDCTQGNITQNHDTEFCLHRLIAYLFLSLTIRLDKETTNTTKIKK